MRSSIIRVGFYHRDNPVTQASYNHVETVRFTIGAVVSYC